MFDEVVDTHRDVAEGGPEPDDRPDDERAECERNEEIRDRSSLGVRNGPECEQDSRADPREEDGAEEYRRVSDLGPVGQRGRLEAESDLPDHGLTPAPTFGDRSFVPLIVGYP